MIAVSMCDNHTGNTFWLNSGSFKAVRQILLAINASIHQNITLWRVDPQQIHRKADVLRIIAILTQRRRDFLNGNSRKDTRSWEMFFRVPENDAVKIPDL